jgi:ABC-type polysaccharide/polyol phosphate transport system ATPase subunit
LDENGNNALIKPVVSIEKLHFSYQIRNASARTLKQNFIDIARGIKSDIHIHAIDGVNFELGPGEVLGIIGNNGAGKSTLLKLMAGILPPTTGNIEVHGRIAPLIELGAGFNPELTGAENIVLFGVMLGNSRKIMEENVHKIADWAGLTDSVNLPIRTYSTGMLSRLGFAVATFEQSELLIIDEVLSVGDIEFQIKSMQRMDELISAGEATVLVSHDLNLVQEKSSKVLWLENGRQVMFGKSKEVVDAYRNA